MLAAARAAAEDGAKQVDEAWLKAIKANDVNALVACYAPDAVMWLPDAPEAKGEAAIRATYAGLLAANTVVDASLQNAVYQTAGQIFDVVGQLHAGPQAQGRRAERGHEGAVSERLEEGRRAVALPRGSRVGRASAVPAAK